MPEVVAATRLWRPGFPVDPALTLGSLRRGGADPCLRVEPAGTGPAVVWRATRNTDGAVLLRLAAHPGRGEVEASAWGPGADRALGDVPDLLGARDRPQDFRPAPAHPRLVSAWRARPAWRVPRSGAVFEALAAAALEQRVTGKEAKQAWRALVVQFGEVAPGPAGRAEGGPAAGMRLPPTPAGWREIPSWVWLRAGVEEARRRVVVAASHVAGRLEATLDVEDRVAVARALRSVPGVGVWTAAEVRQRAHGDADAFSFADFHAAANTSWALAGRVLDDAGCAEVLEVYRGHRYRVQRLLELDGVKRPRRGPRMNPPTHLPALAGLARVSRDPGREHG